MSGLLTRYIKNSSWVLAGNLVSRGFNLVTVASLARLLGPSVFGTYNLTIASCDSFAQMADLGTGVVVQRSYAGYQTNTSAAIGNRFAGAIWLFVLFYGLLTAVLFLSKETRFATMLLPVKNEVLLLIGISFTSRLNQYILVPLTGLQLFQKHAYRNTLNAGLVWITVGSGAWWFGLNGALFGLLLANCLSILITSYWLAQEHRHYAIPIRWFSGLQAIPGLIKQGFLLYMGNTLSGAIYNLLLVSLVMQYVPLTDYAYVRVGLSLASLVGLFVAALQPVTLSALADNAAPEQHTQLKSVTIRGVFCLLLLGTLWLIALNDVIVSLLFGKLYLNGLSIIATMLIITSVQILNQFYVSFLVAKGLGNFIGLFSVGTIALSVALAYWLIPQLGIWGYLISYGSGYVAGLLLAFWKEITTTMYEDQTLLVSVFGYTALLLISAFFITQVASPLARAGLCLGLTIPFASIWYFFILHAAERSMAVNFIHKFYRK